jgi:hypothetical protein
MIFDFLLKKRKIANILLRTKVIKNYLLKSCGLSTFKIERDIDIIRVYVLENIVINIVIKSMDIIESFGHPEFW